MPLRMAMPVKRVNLFSSSHSDENARTVRMELRRGARASQAHHNWSITVTGAPQLGADGTARMELRRRRARLSAKRPSADHGLSTKQPAADHECPTPNTSGAARLQAPLAAEWAHR